MTVSRRSFLTGLGALVGGVALEKAIPFNRVWSFPTVVKPRYKHLVYGVGGQLTRRHYDMIIEDDLVELPSVELPEEILQKYVEAMRFTNKMLVDNILNLGYTTTFSSDMILS